MSAQLANLVMATTPAASQPVGHAKAAPSRRPASAGESVNPAGQAQPGDSAAKPASKPTPAAKPGAKGDTKPVAKGAVDKNNNNKPVKPGVVNAGAVLDGIVFTEVLEATQATLTKAPEAAHAALTEALKVAQTIQAGPTVAPIVSLPGVVTATVAKPEVAAAMVASVATTAQVTPEAVLVAGKRSGRGPVLTTVLAGEATQTVVAQPVTIETGQALPNGNAQAAVSTFASAPREATNAPKPLPEVNPEAPSSPAVATNKASAGQLPQAASPLVGLQIAAQTVATMPTARSVSPAAQPAADAAAIIEQVLTKVRGQSSHQPVVPVNRIATQQAILETFEEVVKTVRPGRPAGVEPTEVAEVVAPQAPPTAGIARPTTTPLMEANQPLPTNVIDRVADALRTSASRNGETVVIKLNPPELGRVRVSLATEGREVSGTLEVENPRTLAGLQREAAELIGRLSEAGIQMRRMDFSLSDQGGGDPATDSELRDDSGHWQGDSEDLAGQSAPEQVVPTDSAGDTEEDPAAPVAVVAGAVNVWI